MSTLTTAFVRYYIFYYIAQAQISIDFQIPIALKLSTFVIRYAPHYCYRTDMEEAITFCPGKMA